MKQDIFYPILEIEYKNGSITQIDITINRTAGTAFYKVYANKKGVNGQHVDTVRGRRQIVLKILKNVLDKQANEIKTVYQY